LWAPSCASQESDPPLFSGAGGETGSPASTTGTSTGSPGATSTVGAGGASPTGAGAGGNDSGTGGDSSDGGVGNTGSGGAPETCVEDDECEIEDECGRCQLDTTTNLRRCVSLGKSICGDDIRDVCEVCDGEDVGAVTCRTLGPFSGGVPRCNDDCQGYDTSVCSVCGDGDVEAGEDCEAMSVGAGGGGGASGASAGGASNQGPEPTCDALGFESGPDDLACIASACVFDTSSCVGCRESATRCLNGNPGTCMGTNCNGAECPVGSNCNFTCRDNGANRCTGASCGAQADCHFDCQNGAGCTAVTCHPTATCDLECRNGAGAGTCSGDFYCNEGDCTYACENGGQCLNLNVTCATDGTCTFNCENQPSACSGKVRCLDGANCDFICNNHNGCEGWDVTCETGSTCNFTCQNGGGACPNVTCEAGSECVFNCNNNDCGGPDCASGVCTCADGATCNGL
jgi:hypothetical protein